MRTVRLLLVEDDEVDRQSFLRCVADQHLPYAVSLASSIDEAKRVLATEPIDIIVSDFRLGDGTALDILAMKLETRTIIATGAGTEDVAVRAMKAGAHDYLIKDVGGHYLQMVPVAVERALRQRKADERVKMVNEKETAEAEIVAGPAFAETMKAIEIAASSASPVFITGETGTGKNLVARAIHYRSSLRAAHFVSINCAALPENLVEGELFGYEKGAFTGAFAAKKGLLEVAEGGTLLLDELGEMPMHLQSKLLGVLDDRKVRRLGSESMRSIDVRVIGATSVNPETALGKRLRSDLFYRLSVIRIALPPLRERRSDIPLMSRSFLRMLNNGIPVDISDAEVSRLQAYSWPGNVRELRNILERALILHRGGEIRPSELIDAGTNHDETSPSTAFGNTPGPSAIDGTLEEVEREHIRHTFERNSGNITRTSKALGISISTLKRKIRRYGLA